MRIEHRKIHYKKLGAGPPLLMVHGWGGTMYSLLRLAVLASKSNTVYLIDLPGFGKSDPPPPHWGIQGYAELVAKIITLLDITGCDYVGHSFGGEIGIYLASHNQQFIRKLVLIASAYKRSNKISTLVKIKQKLPHSIGTLIEKIQPFLKKLYYRIFLRDSDVTRFPHLESNLRLILSFDLTPQIKQIHTPTLILWGEQDTITPTLWAYELNHAIQNSRLVIYPKARHNLPIQHPNLVWNDMCLFLHS